VYFPAFVPGSSGLFFAIQAPNFTKKLLLAAPNYSFYFAGKGIGLFYLLAFVHLLVI